MNIIPAMPKHRGLIFTLLGVIAGLLLSRFLMISLHAGLVVLACGIVLAITLLLRKVDYLIWAWFVLTALLWLVTKRLFPPEYFPYLGRGIFWGLLSCSIAAWAMDSALSRRQLKPFDYTVIKLILAIFLLWSAATLTTSVDTFNSLKKLSHLVIALCASYLFYDWFARDEGNIRRITGVLSIVVLLVSALVIIVATRALLLGAPIYKELQLWFWNPNILGNLVMVSMPLLITSGFRFGPFRRLRLLLLGVCITGLYLSFSRASWLGFLAASMFLLWKGKTRLSLAAVGVLVLIAAALTVPLWVEDFYALVTGQTFTGRTIIWRGAWNTALDYPVFGVGLGNYGEIMPRYIDVPYFKYQTPHSLYLRNAVELGFPSLVISFFFFVAFFYYSYKIQQNLVSDSLKRVARGGMATILAVFVHDFFEIGGFLSTFDAAEFSVMFPYMAMTLPFAAGKLAEKGEKG